MPRNALPLILTGPWLMLAVVALPLTARAADVDLLLALDNSGSMGDEAAALAAELNPAVAALESAGHDVRIIAISADSTDAQGLCVPAPLGSGSCPDDERLPGYRHVVAAVGSANALLKILDEYPSYASSLRPSSSRHVVVVSDDDSALSAPAFTTQLTALDPDFTGFKFHAIAVPALRPTTFPAPPPYPICDAMFPSVGDIGQVYLELTASTGGYFGDLCNEFQDDPMIGIANSILAGLPTAVPTLGAWVVRALLVLLLIGIARPRIA